MFVKQIKDIFNFSMSIEEIEDELAYLYELEINKKENLEDNNIFTNIRPKLYEKLLDWESISTWCNINEFNIDKLLIKLNKKIVQIESSETQNKPEHKNNKLLKHSDSSNFSINPLQNFINCCPKENFSDYYKLFYIIALIFKFALQIKNNEYDELAAGNLIKLLSGYRISIINGKELVNELIELMTKKILHAKEMPYRCNVLKTLSNEYLEQICKKLLTLNKFEDKEKNLLLLAIQFNSFIQVISNFSNNKNDAIKDSVAFAALSFAKICHKENDIENGINFSEIAINISEPSKRQFAYNLLAFFSIDNNQYQRAYDVYFSWIYKTRIKSITSISLGKGNRFSTLALSLQSDNEELWREKDSNAVAVMYGNFAYVCGTMYDNTSDSLQKKRLKYLAKYYITKAIELNPYSSSYYCSAGTIFSDDNNNLKALEFYKQYKDLSSTATDRMNALRSILLVYKEMVLDTQNENELKKEIESVASEFVQQYRKCLPFDKDEKMREELINGKDLYLLLSECEKLTQNAKNTKHLLFKINSQIHAILLSLQQTTALNQKFNLHIELLPENIKEELKEIKVTTGNSSQKSKGKSLQKNISYYTSLNHLQYLFTETKQKENDEPLNCLTMMHARYMNDPEEGLTLLQNFKDYLPQSPEKVRNTLYDQKHVFLKSFTSLVDQLNMWTMYGSDKTTGEDCNGCCICIAPETFDMMINNDTRQKNETAELNFRSKDDFHLYNVAYLDGKDVFVNGQKNPTVKKYYDNLKNLLKNLQCFLNKASTEDKNIISNCIVRLFEKIMFLFKDISYYLEDESRLIITRSIDDRDEIKRTNQEPPKLYITPPYQVYPQKIILGPKVENPDYWIPHLQYELSKIKTKWPITVETEFNPIVRISKINIR